MEENKIKEIGLVVHKLKAQSKLQKQIMWIRKLQS